MNLDRHIEAHHQLFNHLVQGDGDSAQKHREFYDEYLAVMDLTAEFYLQTVRTVFVRHALPKGEMTHRRHRVDPSAIRRVALMTVEGEHDDISGVGQTEAAHALCANIPAGRKRHWLQPAVGHYGVFNGSRFRAEIVPQIADFILASDPATARKHLASLHGDGCHPFAQRQRGGGERHDRQWRQRRSSCRCGGSQARSAPGLEHDPEKPAPDLIRRRYRISEKLVLQENAERVDDLQRRHRGLANVASTPFRCRLPPSVPVLAALSASARIQAFVGPV